jgi:hypothetical protein
MSSFSIAQMMMTLAQLADTSPAERPSGETITQQQTRIIAGINDQLSDTALGLATNGEWVAVWLGLTQDRANLAYIAWNSAQNAFAVSLRGTEFSSLVDLAEDLEVGTVMQFTAGPAYDEPLMVSQGAMESFTEVTSAVFPEFYNANMLQALITLLGNAPANPTLYVTGHSLGGAMATIVALYLSAQTWKNSPTFGVYTFAAPTVGLQAFADCYDAQFGSNSWRYYNKWDVVPNAWASMNNVLKNFYPYQVSSPVGPGPGQSLVVAGSISQLANALGGNVYVQTNQTNGATEINNTVDYGQPVPAGQAPTYDPSFVEPSTGDFIGQLGYQHNSYLAMMGAPIIPSQTPVVATISQTEVVPVSPNNGPVEGGTTVTITGLNFTSNSLVDFGTVAAASVVVVSSTEIQAVSPPGAGIVDIRVTNNFGTSAATNADQFAAPPPSSTQAPVVLSVNPVSGPAEAGYYSVTLTGTGFTSGCSVFFGELQATQVVVLSLTEIVIISPPPPSPAPAWGESTPVVVSVTTTGAAGGGQAPLFNFGMPIVTGVSPSFGMETNGNSKYKNPSVTITGVGFGTEQGSSTVQFVDSTAKNPSSKPVTSISSWNDTQITCEPPMWLAVSDVVTDVTITIKGSNNQQVTSNTVAADVYTYYNQGELGG